MGNDGVNEKVKSSAVELIGNSALTSKFGKDCFALVDSVLRNAGAKSAGDGEVRVTEDADYDWGDRILIDDLKPGDILQFTGHLITLDYLKFDGGQWKHVETIEQERPHHSAVVVEVHDNGTIDVVEQNVKPDPGTVTRNQIPRLEPGEETRPTRRDERVKITVTGRVKAYRPIRAPEKGTFLIRPQHLTDTRGLLARANFIPMDGRAMLVAGPIGLGKWRIDGGDVS